MREFMERPILNLIFSLPASSAYAKQVILSYFLCSSSICVFFPLFMGNEFDVFRFFSDECRRREAPDMLTSLEMRTFEL